jgi:hypothetical protein
MAPRADRAAGFCGGETIVDDDLRDVARFAPRPRASERTGYWPGDLCQFDLWNEGRVPLGHGQNRRA